MYPYCDVNVNEHYFKDDHRRKGGTTMQKIVRAVLIALGASLTPFLASPQAQVAS
jgi:hypothetical protein